MAHLGVTWARRMLAPSWRVVWGDETHPVDPDEPGVVKALVLLTDGENWAGDRPESLPGRFFARFQGGLLDFVNAGDCRRQTGACAKLGKHHTTLPPDYASTYSALGRLGATVRREDGGQRMPFSRASARPRRGGRGAQRADGALLRGGARRRRFGLHRLDGPGPGPEPEARRVLRHRADPHRRRSGRRSTSWATTPSPSRLPSARSDSACSRCGASFRRGADMHRHRSGGHARTRPARPGLAPRFPSRASVPRSGRGGDTGTSTPDRRHRPANAGARKVSRLWRARARGTGPDRTPTAARRLVATHCGGGATSSALRNRRAPTIRDWTVSPHPAAPPWKAGQPKPRRRLHRRLTP